MLSLCARAEISIHGGSDALKANVRAHLDSLAREACDAPTWRLERASAQLPQQIEAAAQALGYYQLNYEREWRTDNNCWQLSLDLQPGPRVYIEDIQFQLLGPGRSDASLLDVQQGLELSVGQPLNHGDYEDAKRAVQKQMQNRGYWQSRWQQSRMQISPSDNQAYLLLQLDTGPKSYFGQLLVPQTALDTSLVSRLAGIEPGTVFTKEKLDLAYERLQSKNYFSSVLLQPSFEQDEGDTDIAMQLAMASKYQLSTGLGYSSDQGPRVSFRLDDHYVNRAGHSWAFHSLWSEDLSEVKFNYRIPLTDPAEQWLDNQLGYLREQTDSYLSRTYTAGSRYVSKLNEQWNWFAALSFQRDLYQVQGQQDENSKLLIPSGGLNYLWLDNPSFTRLGLRVETELLTSSDRFFSDTQFVQFRAYAKSIVPLGSKLRLINRGQFGTTALREFFQLPPSIRFFTGGDNSVRGYDYNSIGEEDENGVVQGGSHLLVGSVELDHPIKGPWYAAAFFDVGTAFDSEADFSRGTGLGLRWRSPIGPLRFDLAKPLDDPDSDYAIHFSVGVDL
ncbi:autotransporter assembly complex protein TamA [Agaribacterium haliotis]|uniref:autotransporter assembly complex protein TamA n=1 Tax=Agaribacterium haliotis TaxID=2013869 RepID=UPI001178AC19|nr:autotransporter assembly complex family protein [Agaribacterium haliotis]